VVDLNNEFRALSLTNTRYLLTNEYIEVASHIPLKLVHQGIDNWYVYENLNVLPRAFVVHRAIVAADETGALKILEDDNFNPHQAVILETGDPLPALLPAETTLDEVTRTGETATSIEFEATLASNGFLVLLDNDYPGWQAYVDGQPASIIRADYFARAVYLTEGSHSVQFIYRPASFRLGLALTSIGLLCLFGLVWLARITADA
jgi:hypothetical protein